MSPSPGDLDRARELGKREAAKRDTRRAIRRAAMALFLEHGFDAVTTAQVAEAARVSPATLFNHFATKESLFFGQVRQLERELADVVQACPPGSSIFGALKGHVLYELTAGRAESNPDDVAPFHEQVARSARLQARENEMFDRREVVLTDAIAAAVGPDTNPLQARVAARLYVAAEKLIATELREQLTRVPPAQAMREIGGFIDQVFAIVESGVGALPAGDPAADRSRATVT